MKKLICIMLAFSMLFTLFGANVVFADEETGTEVVFNDIADSWAKEDIETLSKSGIINGVGEGMFAPNRQISRAEFLAMMFRVLKLSPVEYENIYGDVTENDWYATMLQSMYELDLLDKEGFGGDFNGSKAIKREEMASLLACGYVLYAGSVTTAETEYSDSNKFSDWAKEAIDKVSTLGIMQGKEDNEFCAQDSATREETAAVILRLMNAFTSAGFDTSKMPWKQAPVIYRTTDEVKPGEAFNINGYGLNENSKIYIEDAKIAKNEPGENAKELEVIQRDANDMHYVSAILPDNMEAGVYKVWTQNEYGMSNGIYLNKARIFWVACSDITYEGLTVQIIGVNFMADQFGGENNTSVKLKVNNKEYSCEITELEPYCVKFTVPEGIALGKCDILLTNDGVNQSIMDNEQTFYVVEKGNDPYGLGVAWEKNYVYDYRINIKDFGAKGDGIADDTYAFKAALADIKEHGGGIVYIPIGTYRASTIKMPGKVIFEGEDREKTKIAYCGTDIGGTFVVSGEDSLKIGYQGFTNLTFIKSPEVTNEQYPDSLFWIGNPWGSDGSNFYSQVGRTFEGFFMNKVTVDFPLEIPKSGRCISWAVITKYLLIQDYKATGFKVSFMPVVGNYYTMRNTSQKPVSSSNESCGCYAIFENNVIDMQSQITNEDGSHPWAQGIFLRSHAYCAHNRILNTGTPGMTYDGEIFCTENTNNGTVKMEGDVVNATLNTLTLKPILKADGTLLSYNEQVSEKNMVPCFGEYYVLIVDGRGMGQMRIMTSYDGYTFTIDKPWDIVPDGTSKAMLTTNSVKCIYYDNYAENCEKGFWFYGGSYDSIMANNVGYHTEGLFSLSYHVAEVNMITPVYFSMFKDNELEGGAKLGDTCPVAIKCAYEIRGNYTPFEITDIYSCSIKGNTMKNALHKASSVKYTEGDTTNGIIIGIDYPYDVPTKEGITKGYIIEGNKFINMSSGIKISGTNAGGTSGVIVKDNEYKNVKEHVSITDGVMNILKINEK